jgi:3-deoxy-D-manno-octulosonic-acid transferase
VWIHAVSLGETRAAAPLVMRILDERPRSTVLLTSMTATGREAGRALAGPRVMQAWLPYDLPGATRRFLAHFHPSAGLLMETELWPNLAA